MRGHFGREVYNTMALAYELKRPLTEVATMTSAERVAWLAFFELRAEERKNQR